MPHFPFRAVMKPVPIRSSTHAARISSSTTRFCCDRGPSNPARYARPVLAEALAATLICLDPGHATHPAVGPQYEPIGPGSRVTKIKDGGGAAGEAEVVLGIARRTRAELRRRGYRVVMTRDGGLYRGGNIERARFCNQHGAALMLRIHA